MRNRKRAAVILAAGKGKRMNSPLPKVLHELGGKPLIQWVIESVESVSPEKIVVVVGHGAEVVKEKLKGFKLSYADQFEQLGTAHAVKQAASELKGFQGDVFVLCGDVPLIRPETLNKMLGAHSENESAVTLLSADVESPSGYGRILRDSAGNVSGNVEERDANDEERKIREINSGEYVFDAEFLFDSLDLISSDNEQGEYYLPDLIGLAVSRGVNVSAVKLDDEVELSGVNRPEDLKKLESRIGVAGNKS